MLMLEMLTQQKTMIAGRMLRSSLILTCLLNVAAIAMTTTPIAAQTTHDVDVGPGNAFNPAHITIQTGDTVRWTWIDGVHNVESGTSGNHDDNFRSGNPVNNPGMTFEVTFDQAFLDDHPMPDDVYPYYCSLHWFFGMTGSVTVEPATSLCPKDLNDDSVVNVFDLLTLLGDWGVCAGCPTDLNNDDVVNVFDLLALLGAWGECP